MNISVQEHWQVVNDLAGKKERSQERGRQLRDSVVGLLLTREGRESIRTRLTSKGGPFSGLQRFLDEINRAFESPGTALVELSPRDRLEIQEAVVTRSRPSLDVAHWNMLWLLQREGHIGVGQLVLESLAKVTKKSDDLVRTLRSLQAWERLAPERIFVLFEAAKKASSDNDMISRIDRVLSWAEATMSDRARSGAHALCSSPAIFDDRGANQGAENTSGASRSNAAVPAVGPAAESEHAKLLGKPIRSAAREESPQSLATLLSAIDRLFRRCEDEQEKFRKEQEVTCNELNHVRDELQAQKEQSGEYRRKVERLEQVLTERTLELAAIRERACGLEKQITESKQVVEAARRRAEDYIHDATLARDNSVRSFQASLWERVRACLVEVLDEHPDHADLNPEQIFFRQRLIEIREALRELGVPPY